VLLFVEDGYLSELEVYGVEGSNFAGLPNPDSLKLSDWSTPSDRDSRHPLNS
jgi:hypothetical protein